MRKFSALLAAALFAFVTLAPAGAAAQHRRGDRGYDRDRGHHSERYDRRGDRHHRRDRDHSDAVAAGVLGLVLGVVIASAAQDAHERRQRAEEERYYERDDGYYEDDRSAYEQDYSDRYDNVPPPAPQCTRPERQWDRYAQRYVTVDVPC